MAKRDDGGRAFPMNVLDQGDSGNLLSTETQYGMTLRDWFAGQALQAFMRLSYSSGSGYMQYKTHADEAAECAYALADAMLAARDK